MPCASSVQSTSHLLALTSVLLFAQSSRGALWQWNALDFKLWLTHFCDIIFRWIWSNRELSLRISKIKYILPLFYFTCQLGLKIRLTASPVHVFTQLQLSCATGLEHASTGTSDVFVLVLSKCTRLTSGQGICGAFVCELASLKG